MALIYSPLTVQGHVGLQGLDDRRQGVTYTVQSQAAALQMCSCALLSNVGDLIGFHLIFILTFRTPFNSVVNSKQRISIDTVFFFV